MAVAAKPVVYVETSVVSYYTARPSRDYVVRGHQETTRQWWPRAGERFQLVVSELVIDEAGAGDPEAARKRLQTIRGLPLLFVTPQCSEIADCYVKDLPLSKRMARDALHLAIASLHGVDYLVTWNCTHIANALIRRKLAEINGFLNLSTPIVCTPEEMMEDGI